MLFSIHMTFIQQDTTHAIYVADHPNGFFKLFVPLKRFSGSAPNIITVTIDARYDAVESSVA